MIFFFQLDLCDMTMKGGGVKCKYPPVTSLPIIDAATMMEQKNEWLIICHISGVACPTFSVGHISLHLFEFHVDVAATIRHGVMLALLSWNDNCTIIRAKWGKNRWHMSYSHTFQKVSSPEQSHVSLT